ncbi:DUF3168 domain-containing protein [Neorhizobium alkalisoli]|uniref:Uncharacterized protein DUF3168 n=1 Tax=Neorhizobium alkalisoli TaxID=528178 RepID=A0A561R358_9HYPH|nr:DUF3168 domain-containing protein [Neorhizobium alkalisoli]TWF57003.1 uncharacterized protein DUF3168 [Neorhizobium alkalisoli]
MTAAGALLKAIHQRVSGDPALATIIGPDGLYDRLLARPKFPCIVFGDMETRDYSTGTEPGEEHFLTLEIWSDADGRRQVQEIAGLLGEVLAGIEPALEGAALVNLVMTGLKIARQPKTRFYLAEMRLRAVTE